MSTPPPGSFDRDSPAPPPPPAGGPWASDNLPPNPMAAAGPAEVEQPPSVRTAVRLMWAGAALSALGTLLVFTQVDAIRNQIEESEPTLTSSEVDAAVTVGVAITVVIGIVGVGLWLWMASANGQGKLWARVVATVLGVLNAIGALFTLSADTSTGLSIASSVVSLGLAVVILVLLYRPESSRFYEARSRAAT